MDYIEFKSHIDELLGIDLSAYKENQMKRRINAYISKKGGDYAHFLDILKCSDSEIESFKSYLTINVSEFFRNKEQWEVLENNVLPYLFGKRTHLNIWSAACSSGDEPYSLAILLNRRFRQTSFSILATDIDLKILDKAKKGRYPNRQVENIITSLKEETFEFEEGYYTINKHIKSMITFKQHDLIKDKYPSQMDLIICRNVLIYFTDEIKTQIYKKFYESLNKGGILFVGGTEQIVNPSIYGFKSYCPFFYIKD